MQRHRTSLTCRKRSRSSFLFTSCLLLTILHLCWQLGAHRVATVSTSSCLIRCRDRICLDERGDWSCGSRTDLRRGSGALNNLSDGCTIVLYLKNSQYRHQTLSAENLHHFPSARSRSQTVADTWQSHQPTQSPSTFIYSQTQPNLSIEPRLQP